MKPNLLRFIAVLTCITAVASVALAQNDPIAAAAAGERYTISAKAGGVNFVQGAVNVARKVGKSGVLVKGDSLEVGDKVTTGADGRAEILLNPGSFVRLGSNTAFEFKTTELDDLQLRVESGSAIFEVFAGDEFHVSIETPKTTYIVIETGVYRVDVQGVGTSRLAVWKGSARIEKSADRVKAGRAAMHSASGSISVAKFDRDNKDEFDAWSRDRGKELAKLTRLLKNADLRRTLLAGFLGRRWNVYNSFGLWVYDPIFGAYCFLPFGWGWSSPYGWGYGHYLGYYNFPPVIYYPPHNSGGGGTGNPTNPGPTITPIVSAGDRSPAPPFVRMGQTMGVGYPDRGGSSNNSSYDSSSSSPSYSPSSSSSSSSSGSSSTTKSDPGTATTKGP